MGVAWPLPQTLAPHTVRKQPRFGHFCALPRVKGVDMQQWKLSIIHWNGHVPHKATVFLVKALTEHFGGGPHKLHFNTTSNGTKGWLCSEVVDKCLSQHSI